MKVLALASYPVEAAATRYRLAQYVAPLATRGVELTIHPFIDSNLFARLYSRTSMVTNFLGLTKSVLFRLREVVLARKFDVLLVQREAMIVGPPFIEWLIARVLKCPMVLDLDDATYVRYTSPTYGGIGSALKWFSKTDDLIKWSAIVVCGNRAIAEYVNTKGATARIIPTVVDTDTFRSRDAGYHEPVVLGWVGTHSTFPYLESIFPVLSELSTKHKFRLRIVGAGKSDVSVHGFEVESLPWKLDREVQDFQSIDIGLYPIDASLYSGKWAQGKSGFKAIQYMAVGIPYVATPVGAVAEIGEAGATHFFASTSDEWYTSLERLLKDESLRKRMGAAGRNHVVKHFGLEDQANKLAFALREAIEKCDN